jgi:hypothetical protein
MENFSVNGKLDFIVIGPAFRDYVLTPKGLRGVFSKKHSKTAVSSSRSPTDFFSFF